MLVKLTTSVLIGGLAVLLILIEGTYPIISTISMGMLALILLSLRNQARDTALFVGFAILASIAEALIVKTGAWYYSHPLFLGLPGWLPFAWGISVVVAHDIYHLFHKHYHDEQKKLFMWTELFLYVVCIYLSMTFFYLPWLLIALTALILLVNIRLHHPKEELFFVIYFVLIGCAIEVIGFTQDLWGYTSEKYVLQIIWMSLMYAQFALIARRTSLFIASKCR